MYSATFAGPSAAWPSELLRDPQRIDVASHTDTHADIEQRLHWADDLTHKNALLDHILTERSVEQALVFTSTQRDADWLADRLAEMGHAVASLHGGMPQGRRNRVLQACAASSCACWWPPTWPRAASTCRPSATSSTTACR
jgi:superfamily II DNA/RNA helicase